MPVTLPDHVVDALDALDRRETEAASRAIDAGEDVPQRVDRWDIDSVTNELRASGDGAAADWLATHPLAHSRAFHEGRAKRGDGECTHEFREDGDERVCEICDLRVDGTRHEHEWVRLEGDGVAARVCRSCGATAPG